MMGTTNYNLPLVKGTDSVKVPRDLNALSIALDTALKNVDDVVTRIDQSTKGTITNVKLTSNENGTTKIQEALNLKGIVNVFVSGVAFISNTLLIGNDTELNILGGTLKLLSGTRKYMIMNSDQVNGNFNIKITGKWDVDGDNNLNSGPYPTGYPGFGMLLRKIDGLSLENLLVKNAKKYAILTVDSKNLTYRNIEFDTFSDGLHFQPPIKNCRIENVFGRTHDDMIAFTMEDYANYNVNSTGNVEDVSIENIHMDDCWNGIGFHGSGSDGLSVFRNISINNVRGYSRQKAIGVATDSGSEFATPVKTKMYGLKINNVHVKGTPVANIMLDAYEGDARISNVTIAGTNKFIRVNGLGDVGWKTIQVDNMALADETDLIGSTDFINVSGIVRELIVNGVGIESSNATHSYTFLNLQQANIKSILLNNVKSRARGIFVKTSAGVAVGSFVANNLDIAKCDVLSTASNIELYLNNFMFDYANLAILACVGDSVQVRLQGEGKARLSITGGTNRKFSLNSRSFEWTKSNNDVTNAKKTDFVNSVASGYEGLWAWNGTAFVKLV